jgi:ribose transport system substrate-binding protein
MKPSKIILIVIIIFSTFFLSCSKKEEPAKGTKTIGVSLLTRGHIFYRDLEDGLKKEAAKDNYQLIITSADFDLGKQVSQIEDFISRKVNAIIVCPVDSKGVGSGIVEANNANIPVFTADIAAEEGKVVCHVASDNVQGGKLAGEYIAKYLNGKGKIAIIDQPAITSVLDRVQGFRDALSGYPDILIVADVNGQGVRDRSLQAATDVLQAHPDLDAIFGINDDSALGALDAVQQYNKKNIIIIGYDATPPAVDAILKSTPLKADVVQYPDKIGEKTIQIIKEYFDGKQVPSKLPVDVGIVDKITLERNKSK